MFYSDRVQKSLYFLFEVVCSGDSNMTKTLIFPDLQVNIWFSSSFDVLNIQQIELFPSYHLQISTNLDQIPRSLYRRDRVNSSVENSDRNIKLYQPL